MPELPEVETLVRELKAELTGAILQSVHILSPASIAEPQPLEFARQLSGRKVLDSCRRGKHAILLLSDGWHLIVHFRMTGRLLITNTSQPTPRWARVQFRLRDGRIMWFVDMRKFGRLILTPYPDRLLMHLGPEPFDPALDAATFHAILKKHRRPIKSLLLDQRAIAGIGNIYADESLFEAGINPLRQTCDLGHQEASNLLQAIRRVLTSAIENRGTTIATYSDARGIPGEHQAHLQAYGRAGNPCARCGTDIVRIRLSGRGTCYCPQCQPMP